MLAVWVALLTAVVGLAPTSAHAQSTSDANAFIDGVNSVRANLGLPALVADSQLTAASLSWTQAQQNGVCPDAGDGISGNPDLPGTDWICHAPNIAAGLSHNWSKVGENVGTGGSVDAVMNGFINSPSHYENIVDPDFTHIGVAVVWDAEARRLHTTHRFMALRNSAPSAEPVPPQALAVQEEPDVLPQQAPTTTTAAPRAEATTAAPSTIAPVSTTQAPSTTAASDQPSEAETARPSGVNIDPDRAAVLMHALAALNR